MSQFPFTAMAMVSASCNLSAFRFSSRNMSDLCNEAGAWRHWLDLQALLLCFQFSGPERSGTVETM